MTKPTAKQTAAALEASIKHWDELARKDKIEEEDIGFDKCALCDLFYNFHDCKGCPIALKTDDWGCRGTPYTKVTEAIRVKDFPTAKKHAKEMLEFLISLRRAEK